MRATTILLAAMFAMAGTTVCGAGQGPSNRRGALEYLTEAELQLIRSQTGAPATPSAVKPTVVAQPAPVELQPTPVVSDTVAKTKPEPEPVEPVSPPPDADRKIARMELEARTRSLRAAEAMAGAEEAVQSTSPAAVAPAQPAPVTVAAEVIEEHEAEQAHRTLRAAEQAAKSKAATEPAYVEIVSPGRALPGAPAEAATVAKIKKADAKARKRSIKEALRLMDQLEAELK